LSLVATIASRRYISRCCLGAVVVAEDRERAAAAAVAARTAVAGACAGACASRRGKHPMMMMLVAVLACIPPDQGPDAAHGS